MPIVKTLKPKKKTQMMFLPLRSIISQFPWYLIFKLITLIVNTL